MLSWGAGDNTEREIGFTSHHFGDTRISFLTEKTRTFSMEHAQKTVLLFGGLQPSQCPAGQEWTLPCSSAQAPHLAQAVHDWSACFSSSCQSGFHLYQKAQIPWSEDLPTPFTSIAGAGFTLWNHSVLLPPGSCKVVSVETVVLHLASTHTQTPQQQALASPSARWFWPRRHSTSTA